MRAPTSQSARAPSTLARFALGAVAARARRRRPGRSSGCMAHSSASASRGTVVSATSARARTATSSPKTAAYSCEVAVQPTERSMVVQ